MQLERFGLCPLHVIATAVGLLAAFTTPLFAQVSNGDFSSGLGGWTVVLPSSNQLTPDRGVESIDIDGSGSLGVSSAFYANVGYDSLLNLEQVVSLSAGISYNFRADLAMTTPSVNADGGTISVFIGPTLLQSYSFGDTVVGVNEYARISSTYLSPVTGSSTLSIHFSRNYGAGIFSTPTDYVDNIQLTPVPEPGTFVLVFCGLSLLALIHRRNGIKRLDKNA